MSPHLRHRDVLGSCVFEDEEQRAHEDLLLQGECLGRLGHGGHHPGAVDLVEDGQHLRHVHLPHRRTLAGAARA